MTHPYVLSPHSNAGNCECGMAEESRTHPHAYTQAYREELCVCAYPADHPIHTDAATAQPTPYPKAPTSGLRGTDAARAAVRTARGGDAPPTFTSWS
ncbi:hypothetical protein ACFV1H_17875 [Streptomyces virginiae]|uniref:hypothetical protein n=1 Tax=Streptomyces virginiae TaxID=1961 RepID=UPI00369AD740